MRPSALPLPLRATHTQKAKDPFAAARGNDHHGGSIVASLGCAPSPGRVGALPRVALGGILGIDTQSSKEASRSQKFLLHLLTIAPSLNKHFDIPTCVKHHLAGGKTDKGDVVFALKEFMDKGTFNLQRQCSVRSALVGTSSVLNTKEACNGGQGRPGETLIAETVLV